MIERISHREHGRLNQRWGRDDARAIDVRHRAIVLDAVPPSDPGGRDDSHRHLRSGWLELVADMPRVLSFLLEAAGRGAVTPAEAEKLARLVSEYAKAVELTEIEERVRRLEEAAAGRV